MANITLDFLHNYHTGERRESDPANAYQYDEGHVLEAVLPEVVTSAEINYWIRGMENADAYAPGSITPNEDGSCTVLGNIPNKYFETNGELRIYIVVNDDNASITTYEGMLHICQRSMPDDYVDDDPDNEATRVLVEAQEAAATATQKAADAATSAEQAAESARTLTLDTTLTQSGQAADAKAAGDEITSLKEDFTQVNKEIINELTDTLSATATFIPFAYPVFEGKKYKMTNQSTAGAMLAYTRATPTGANIDNILGSGTSAGYSKEFTASADASYIVVYVNTATTGAKFTIEQLDNIPDRVSATEEICTLADEALTYSIDPKDLAYRIGVGANISTGLFSGTDNTMVVFDDYIEINETSVVTNHNTTRYVEDIMTISRVYFYNSSKQFISNSILLPLESATIPANTKYVRFSYTYLQTTMTAAVADTFNTDVESKLLNVKEYVDENISIAVPPIFYVGADRVGVNTFKTLKAVTEYIWSNNINGATVYVDRGTYDLVTEYGSEYLESLVDPGFNPRALGLKCGKNTRFIFESGAKIQFLYTGENTYVAQMFSPINIAGSCTFENMQIEARNCRYCVHEDYYTIDTTYVPYTVQYINCDMLYREKTLEGGTNGEPIGGGCMPGSTSIIDGGKYINEVNQADISYHNYAISSFGQGISKVFIKNAYMSHWCSFGDYGDSVVYGYVSGCRMKSEPIVGNPDAIITKWGNTIES